MRTLTSDDRLWLIEVMAAAVEVVANSAGGDGPLANYNFRRKLAEKFYASKTEADGT